MTTMELKRRETWSFFDIEDLYLQTVQAPEGELLPLYSHFGWMQLRFGGRQKESDHREIGSSGDRMLIPSAVRDPIERKMPSIPDDPLNVGFPPFTAFRVGIKQTATFWP